MQRVVAIFREGMEYSRMVHEWIDSFLKRTNVGVEIIDPDLNSGFLEAYDIVEYPTILVLDERGAILASWRGTMLPLIDEIMAYML